MRSAVAGDRAGCSHRPGTGTALTWSRRARWLAWFAAATAFWLLALAIPASAHAVFVSASPAPGASLTRAPALLRIVFSEPLVPALSGVELQASSGKQVRPRSARVDPRDHSAYELSLPRLRPDRYTVIWHTTSQVDGHFRAGTYTFTVLGPGGAAPLVGSAAAPPAAPAQLPASLQAATSFAELAGLFLVVGTALMLLLGGLSLPTAARLFGWLLAAAGAATLVGAGGQFAATWAPTGWQASALPSVLGSDVARWLWLRLGAVAAVLLAWPWPAGRARPPRRRPVRPARRLVPTAAALAMVVSFGATAHPAASAYPVAGLAFITVHILAASVWVGGVLGLAIVWGLARRHGANPDERSGLLRRFSLLAGMAVPAVAATGAASALLELGSIADFVRSGYGIALLAKLAAAAAVGVAAVSNVLVHRHGPVTAPERSGRVRTGLWAEAGLGLLVLVPAAIMSVLGPPGPADAVRGIGQQLAAASDPANAFTADSTLGHGGLELSLTPGTAGTNAVRIEVDGADAVTQLRVGLTKTGGPVLATVQRTGYDHDPQTHTVYQGSITLPAAGAWTAVVRGPAVTSPPIAVPLRAALAGAQAGQAAAPRLYAWLLAIAVLGAAGMAAGAARCVPGRRWRGASFALGGAGGIAALAGIAVLSLAARSSASAAVSSSWGTASRVTPATGNNATTWPVGGQEAGLMMPAVGPDGSVWVGEMDANALARLGPGRDLVQQFPLPGGYKEVMGVAVDGDNHVWIAEEHAQALGMFDPATGRYRQYRVPGDDPAPVGVAVDASGQVWFTMMNGNAIGRLDPGTAGVTEYPIPAAHALPYWLAVGPHGQVWFTEFGAGKLGVLNPATGKIGEYPVPDGGSPVGIAIGSSGTVWATAIQGLVIRMDTRTGAMRVFHAPRPDEYGAAVAGDGTVWIGLASGAVVYSLDPATAAFSEHKLPAGSDPWWVAAGPAHVWVALSSGAQGELGELGEAIHTARAGSLRCQRERCDMRIQALARRAAEAPSSSALPRRVRLLLDASLALSTEHDLDALLRRFTAIACEVIDARYGALLVEDIGTLVTFVTHGISEEQYALIGEPPSRSGLHGQLLRDGKTVVIDNLLSDSRATGYPAHHPAMRSFLGTPIRAGARVIGELYLADKHDGQRFDNADVEIVEALAAVAGVAYRNARLLQIEQQSAAHAQAMLDLRAQGNLDEMVFWSQVWAREDERARLARDIHDEQGQILTSLILFAKHLEQQMDGEVAAQVSGLRQLAEQALRAARTLAQQLRPLELDQLGLVPALNRLVEHTAQRCGVAVDFVAGPRQVSLTYALEVVVYRIAQQALTNVARHSRAHSASVTLNGCDGWLTLIIEDDGVGFDCDAVLTDTRQGAHTGIRTMRDRARSVGGDLMVESDRGTGTLVRLRVPTSGEPAGSEHHAPPNPGRSHGGGRPGAMPDDRSP